MDLIDQRRRLPRPMLSDRRGRLALGALAAATGIIAGAAAGAAPAAGSASGRIVLLAFALTGLLIAAVVTDLRRVLLAVLLVDLAFGWDVNIAYRTDIGEAAGLGGFNLSLTTLALTCLYLVWIAELLADARAAPRPRLRPAATAIAFFGVLVASTLVAQDRTVAGFEVALIAQMVALFVYVSSTIRSRREVRFIVIVLLWGLLLSATVSLAGYATGGLHVPGTAVHPPSDADPLGSRLAGTFGAPNTAGAYFAFMLTLAIALCLSPVGRGMRQLALVAAVPATIALTLTLSRGAWIAVIVSVLVVMLGARGLRGNRVSVQSMVAVAVGLVIVVVPLQGAISSRLNADDRGAAESRLPLMRVAADIIYDHPLLGVGANNFAVVLPDYAGPAYSSGFVAIVHNKFLLIWAESGLAALAAFLAFLWVTISRGWRGRRLDDALLAATALGLGAAVAGHAVHMNFDTFQSRPMTQTLWLAAALVASPALLARRRGPAGAEERC